MGKRLEDLNIDATPHQPTAPIETPDLRDTPWARFITEIDNLLATGEYTWAEETLRSIQITVGEKRWVTEGQKRAVANIEEGHERGKHRTHGRRYEGWGRGRW